MQIIQLTDLHIGREGEETYGVDVRGNFLRALDQIAAIKPDLAVITGDLCFSTGDAGVYAWLRAHLEALAIPFEVIPGNHDDTALLADAFGYGAGALQEGELYFSRAWDHCRALFLDTSAGRMSAAQWAWLEDQCATTQGPVLIFMHHPPVLAGAPFMDLNYPFQQAEEFRLFQTRLRIPTYIFCGHYHLERTLPAAFGSISITPSCILQISPESEHFQVSDWRPGLRHIIMEDSGAIRTQVVYF